MAKLVKGTLEEARIGFEPWLGTDSSYSKFLAQREKVELRMASAGADIYALASDWEDDDEGEIEHHWLLQKVGDIGLINVKGCMITGSTSWWSWRDEVGYDDIRNAGIAALNSGCKAVILKFSTGGGQVLGCGACADFLQDILGKAIPLIAYTDTACHSAGVWLASACSKFYCSTTADVGSIGVLGVATEFSEMEKTFGITRKVFRSTELKGYGNPYEKLTPAMAQLIKEDVATTALKFVNQVAKGTGKSLAYVEENLHNGKTWYGDQALQLGLVSKNLTIDQLLVELQEKVSQNNTQFSSGVTSSLPLDLSSQHQQPEITAMAATTFNAQAQAQIDKALADSAAALLASNGQPTEGDPASEETPAPVETPPVETPPAESASTESTLALVAQNTELSTKLIASTTELTALKLELTQLKAEKDAMSAGEQGLRAIAVNAIQWAFTASGSSAPDTTALNSLATPLLVAQHDMAKSMLVKRFGTGGQHAAVTNEEENPQLEAAAQELDRGVLLNMSRIRRDK
jgi:ClpP class serine protease